MTTAITGVFQDLAAAESALAQLVDAGFAKDDISVILAATPHHEKLVNAETSDTTRGALAGLVSGGALASVAFGVLALPGIGVLAAGPLLAALTGGGVCAAAGGVLGAMVGHGLSTQTAQEYETSIRGGGVLLAVHTLHSRIHDARAIMAAAGGAHVTDSVHLPLGNPQANTAE